MGLLIGDVTVAERIARGMELPQLSLFRKTKENRGQDEGEHCALL